MKTLMRNGRDRRSENPFLGHAKKERVSLFGTDQRITSGPAVRRPHSKAEYMTAPERFADSQIPLAPRAPSIHDPKRSLIGVKRRPDPSSPIGGKRPEVRFHHENSKNLPRRIKSIQEAPSRPWDYCAVGSGTHASSETGGPEISENDAAQVVPARGMLAAKSPGRDERCSMCGQRNNGNESQR